MDRLRRVQAIWRDALYALRTMRKKPAFTVTAVLTLALAIGGNTAIFTVIRAVLLKPLPYRDSDRLVRIAGGATPERFAEMQAGAHSFTGLGAYTGQEDITLSGGDEPEVLNGVRVSASVLRILAVDPLRGRGFRAEEDSPGGAPVVLIGAGLWLAESRRSPRSPARWRAPRQSNMTQNGKTLWSHSRTVGARTSRE